VFAKELARTIGRGEAEAIAFARERRERLFMDEQKGRWMAEFYGVETATTLGLLLEMLSAGAMGLTDYESNLKEYGSKGWISGDVIQLFFEKGREIG